MWTMAIGLTIRFAGGTEEQYDAVNGPLGIADDPPEGLIFHAAGPIESGWGVIDFWESREHFDRFLEARLGPAIEAAGAGFPSPPDIREFPVHNIVKP